MHLYRKSFWYELLVLVVYLFAGFFVFESLYNVKYGHHISGDEGVVLMFPALVSVFSAFLTAIIAAIVKIKVKDALLEWIYAPVLLFISSALALLMHRLDIPCMDFYLLTNVLTIIAVYILALLAKMI